MVPESKSPYDLNKQFHLDVEKHEERMDTCSTSPSSGVGLACGVCVRVPSHIESTERLRRINKDALPITKSVLRFLTKATSVTKWGLKPDSNGSILENLFYPGTR